MSRFAGCGPETPTFVISATVSSFFLPLLIMAVMYILTVQALHSQRKDNKRLAITSINNSSISVKEDSSNGGKKQSPRLTPRPSPSTRRTTRYLGGEASDKGMSLHSENSLRVNNNLSGGGDRRLSDKGLLSDSSVGGHYVTGAGRSPLLKHRELPSPDSSPTSPNGRSNEYMLVNPNDQSDITPSSTYNEIAMEDIPADATVNNGKPRKLKIRTFKFRRSNSSTNGSRKGAGQIDRARKAVQVLGILFAVFVIFYLPFFLTYVINGTCVPCQEYISPQMLTAFEWLAYSGSMVNPIIYHIFNADFQRAFHKLLRCKCRELT